ncbi:peptidase M10 serralysin C terminal family protein [Synechococcus sp. RS9915]|nr:peptidase M10 serralysin C terminal family protein [Synechococcus sp. RS9915]
MKEIWDNGDRSYLIFQTPLTLENLQELSYEEADRSRERFYSGDDIIEGSRLDNELNGYLGDDTIIGRSGDDVIYTGAGKNNVQAGKGDDLIISEGIRDKVWTGHGDDAVIIGRNSNKNKSAMQIMDFDAESDIIGLDTDKFSRYVPTVILTQEFSGSSGEVVVERKSKYTQLMIDTSGNEKADLFVKLFRNDSLDSQITPENFEYF